MSREMRAIRAFFMIRKRLGFARLGRKPKSPAEPSSSMLKKLSVTKSELSGFQLYQVQPSQIERVIIYLHGGGYVNPIAKQHWQLIEHLSLETSALVYVPRYGLAPRHQVSEAIEFVSQVLRIAQSHNLEIVMAGDSAGGGLAIATLQQVPEHQVSKLVLISPWLDSDFDHEGMPELSKSDPWLIPENLRHIAKVWSGVDDHRDARVSPLRGDLSVIPKTQLFIGSWDIFFYDCRVLAEKLNEFGIELSYHELSDALHVYPLLPTPEGAEARGQIVDFVGRRA